MIITAAVMLMFILVWHAAEITNCVKAVKSKHLKLLIHQESLVCRQNEARSPCVQNECRIQMCTEKISIIEDVCGGNVDLTCEEIIHGTVKNCSKVSQHMCRMGCVCKSRYLRDSFNSCVPEDNCSW